MAVARYAINVPVLSTGRFSKGNAQEDRVTTVICKTLHNAFVEPDSVSTY